MPARAKILTLPKDVQQKLNEFIIERGYSGYGLIAAWLAEQGHEISTATVARHGQQMKRRLAMISQATNEAEAIVAALPDDTSAMADVSIRLVQERIFQVLMASEEGNLKELSKAALAVATTARAAGGVRIERRKILAEAAKRGGAQARKAGLSPDAVAAIRAAIERGERAREGEP